MPDWAAKKRGRSRRQAAAELLSQVGPCRDAQPTRQRGPYPAEQAQFIRDGYRTMSVVELTRAFRSRFGPIRTQSQIRSYIRNHRVLSGRDGQFRRGQAPWNAGTRGRGLTGANATSFKKGSMPHTKRRLWSERINKDGFIEISVPERNPWTGAATRFRHKHVWLWEGARGPVPKGHAVAFIDGDRLNCVIDNLMLVTRAELLTMNLHGYKDTPAQLKPSVLALAKLEAKAGIRSNPGQGRKPCRPKNGGNYANDDA